MSISFLWYRYSNYPPIYAELKRSLNSSNKAGPLCQDQALASKDSNAGNRYIWARTPKHLEYPDSPGTSQTCFRKIQKTLSQGSYLHTDQPGAVVKMLGCLHSIWTGLDSSQFHFQLQLPANAHMHTLSGSSDGSSTCFPATHIGDLDWVLGSQLRSLSLSPN